MTGLVVIIVSWNTCDLLRRCLESVHASLAGTGIDYTIVVVDNASSDGTPAMVRAEHPDVLLLEPGRNLGFAGGANLALRVILERTRTENREPRLALERSEGTENRRTRDKRQETGDERQETTTQSAICNLQSTIRNPQSAIPDYVLLLNPDAEVVGDAIPRLVRYLEAHRDVAVAGPQLRYPDGSAQPSRRRFPTPGTFFWESTPLEQRWPNNPWARRYRCADTPDEVEQEVDWLVGAALLVRVTAIERAGLLDTGFAMYSEELEWQRRIRAASYGVAEWRKEWETGDDGGTLYPSRTTRHAAMGDLEGRGGSSSIRAPGHTGQSATRIVYVPEAVVIHHEGKSSEQVPAWRLIQFQRSRLRYARMVYGARFAAMLRLFLLGAYSVELALEGAKWLLGHKRPLRAQRVGIYRQVVCALGASNAER
jgi:GT2 family glycosyltransferase